MLGRNEFALRQGFGLWPKRLYGAKAPPHCVGPQFWLASILFAHDKKERHAPQRVFLLGFQRPRAAHTLRKVKHWAKMYFACAGSMPAAKTPIQRKGAVPLRGDPISTGIYVVRRLKETPAFGWCFFFGRDRRTPPPAEAKSREYNQFPLIYTESCPQTIAPRMDGAAAPSGQASLRKIIIPSRRSCGKQVRRLACARMMCTL